MYFLHTLLQKNRQYSYASSLFVFFLFIISFCPTRLMSNHILENDFLSQVEYALIENDTAQAELILQYLIMEKQESKFGKISFLRLFSIQDVVVNNKTNQWKTEQELILFELIKKKHTWKKEQALHHMRESENSFLNDRNIMKVFDQLNEVISVHQNSTNSKFKNELIFLQQLLEDARIFYQNFLKADLSLESNQGLAFELVCFLQKETISRLFWVKFLKEKSLDNPFYFEYLKCVNLLAFNTIKASFFRKQFYLKPTVSRQRQLEDTYDVIFFIQNQIFQKGLFNADRKEFIRNKFNVQEEAIIFYNEQYEITRNKKWMDKILMTMVNIKSSILETNRKYYGSAKLLKDLCRKVIVEIEKLGSPSALYNSNNNILEYIKKQIKISSYNKCFYKIHEHSKNEINELDLNKLKDVCSKNKKEELVIINCFDSKNYFFVLLVEADNEVLNIIPKSNSDSLQMALEYLKETFLNPAIALEATKKSIRQFEKASASVYQSILKPLFRNKKPEHLVVVPDGILNYIPFEVLVVNNAKTNNQNVSYLLHSTAVRYYPSLKLFSKYESSDESIISIQHLVINSPSYKLSEAINNNKSELPILNGARIETETIESLFPSKVVNKKVFYIENEKSLESSNQLFHLAMHASSEYHESKGPALIGSKEEDILFLHDIANLSKVSSVVILSACETGHGEYTSGEGLKSIGQQFLQSGAKCTIQNLNKIEDGTSSELVTRFYKLLKRKEKSHQALQKSKIEFLKQADDFHAHPYFWSGLLAYGQAFRIE